MLSRKIGIDLGSATVRVFVKGEGIVLNEPALVAPDGDGTMALHHLIGRARGRPRLFKPEVIVSVPSAVTATERRAVTEAAMSAGARQVWLIDEPLAAAMGAGLPIGELRASAICEIGASTTEIAVISLSGTVSSASIPVGGRSLDSAIAAGLDISEHAAEDTKIAVGSAVVMETPLVTTVDGREVSSNDIARLVEKPLEAISGAIRKVLAETPPEHAEVLSERGIVLSGGGAQLRGLATFIAKRAGIPAVVADEPQTSVVRGTGLALDHFEVLRRNQSYLR
jgi:rod shape-determining protein MreB and related proteins